MRNVYIRSIGIRIHEKSKDSTYFICPKLASRNIDLSKQNIFCVVIAYFAVVLRLEKCIIVLQVDPSILAQKMNNFLSLHYHLFETLHIHILQLLLQALRFTET